MRISVFLCLAVAILGVQSADKSPEAVTDNIASATSVTAKSSVAPSKNTKRSHPEDEQITAQESQHQYEDRHISPHHQQPQNLISQSEYLAFIRENEREAAAAEGAQESSSPHPYGKLSASPERVANQFYTRNPGHPLAGSSLEKEIEKLISANGQQYAAGGAHEQRIPSPQSPVHEASIQRQHQQQFNGPPQQQQLRSPVVFKNHNDIVYIPYQQQQQQQQQQEQLQQSQAPPRDHYPRTGSGITKAKVQLISPYPPVRAPFPSEAIEYGPGPAPQAPPQYTAIKQQESFKELYIQQQRENHIKRIQAQQQHQQQQQFADDNVNLQSHSQPLSISLLPKKQATVPPAHIIPEQPSESSNFAQFAERLFKTPLDQQKPLSQEMFKALVAAGYPVQAVPVPIAVSKGHAASAQVASYNHPHHHQHQQLVQSKLPVPQRYAQGSVSLGGGTPQPFSHPSNKQPIVQIQYQQTNPQPHRYAAGPAPPPPAPAPQSPHHHQAPPQVHRFYTQGPQYSQPQASAPQPSRENTHTTYQLPSGQQGGAPQNQHGPYTYVLQQGENEESAAEQLRQQIIHEINSQSQKGTANGYTRIDYPQQSAQSHAAAAPQSGGGQGQTLATLTAANAAQAAVGQLTAGKPLTEEQKEYFKRLEYYSHNQ